jgi:predicted nucleic acid-binding Zn ribbon protein
LFRNFTIQNRTIRTMEEDKFKKQTNCGYCGKEMDAKYRSKKFCSDKCRVYFGREDKKTNPEKYVFLNPIRPAREASFEDKQLAKEFLATDGGRVSPVEKEITTDEEILDVEYLPPAEESVEVVVKPKIIFLPNTKESYEGDVPVRGEGENAFDFAARKNEWKAKYNK